MVKNIKLAVMTAVVYGSLSVSAHAGIIDMGITTLDTESGLEWLDLTETTSMSVDLLRNEYLIDGGALSGYRYASQLEVLGLALNWNRISGYSAPANSGDIMYIFQPGAMSGLVGMLGATAPDDKIFGYYEPAAMTTFMSTIYDSPGAGIAMFNIGESYTASNAGTHIGSFLVRDVVSPVPEPSVLSLALLGLGLAGGAAYRKRKMTMKAAV